MKRRLNRLRKRAGRDPGAEKLAEHYRVEQLFAGRAVGVGATNVRIAAAAGESRSKTGAYCPAHEQ